MNSLLQVLYRIGNAMTTANVGNGFEFERLMRKRREDELAATQAPRAASCARPAAATSPRLYVVAQSSRAGKRIRESLA